MQDQDVYLDDDQDDGEDQNHGELTEVTLYYENDEEEEVSYSAFIPYRRIAKVLELMDELHG